MLGNTTDVCCRYGHEVQKVCYLLSFPINIVPAVIYVTHSYDASHSATVAAYFQELKERLSDESPPVVVDVRPEVQFEMCHIPGSTSILS